MPLKWSTATTAILPWSTMIMGTRLKVPKKEPNDGEYIECKLEPPEDTERLSKGGEYVECKLEPPEDTEMLSKDGK